MDQLKAAFSDLAEGYRLAPLWIAIGWDQTMLRFHRTILGPFWLTSGLLGMAFALSFIFGGLFGTTDWRSNFEMVLTGILAWGLVGGSLGDGANAFIMGASFASVQKFPLSFHVAMTMFRTIVNFACQLIVTEILLVVVGRAHVPSLFIIPGFILVVITTFFLSFVLTFPSTRYRDISYSVGLALQFLFFLTPVFWRPEQMHGARRTILELNPLAHEIALIRKPLNGEIPNAADWIWTFGTMLVAAAATVLLLRAYRKRVIFWL